MVEQVAVYNCSFQQKCWLKNRANSRKASESEVNLELNVRQESTKRVETIYPTSHSEDKIVQALK